MPKSKRRSGERGNLKMASVLFVGPEPSTITHLSLALAREGHYVRYTSERVEAIDLAGVDIIFADGEPWHYIRSLLHVREAWPFLPFVVVTPTIDTLAWMDALEAGATDCC